MEVDAWTIFAVGGVASLLIERFFYYKSKYKAKKNDNPGDDVKLGKLETKVEEMDKDNEKDHKLIREDIRKLSNLLNGMRRK